MTQTNAKDPMARPFDWQFCWYPVVFTADFSDHRPYRFSLLGQPFVLYRSGDGHLVCADDRCPHRMARLSDGQITDGQLECLYHGWRFDGSGACVLIPQLPADKTIPQKACLKTYSVKEQQGIIWLWPGAAELADAALIPVTPALSEPGVQSVDYAIDLPYDQSYLIENIIDVAHIHIVHDGIRGGGKRELAKPLAFTVLSNTSVGIAATFRSIGLETSEQDQRINSAMVEFVAPNLIRYTSNYKNSGRIAGLALYSLPLAPGQCRLLYRKYSNFYRWRERWKPRWLEHWTQNTILRQDMALIIGQYSSIQKSGQNLADLWLPLKTSDSLVLDYRQWLDLHAQNMPYFRGFKTFRNPEGVDYGLDAASPDLTRLHTHGCRSCSTLMNQCRRFRNAAATAALILLPLGWWLDPVLVTIAFWSSMSICVVAERVRRQFL